MAIGKLEPDYTDSYQAWQTDPTPQTRTAMLKHVQPVLDQAVLSAAGRNPSPNIRSRAKLMAAKSLDSYDPTRGPLRNHLLSQLRGLQRHVGQEQNIIAVPEQLSLDRVGLRTATEALTDRLGREPSTAELADHTGLSLRRIGHIRSYRPAVAAGSILDETGEVYSPASALPGDNTADDAWAELVYYDLSPTDQTIMGHTLGMHGLPPLQNQELATRLSLSPGAISQRKAKIQAMLDSRQQVGF